MAKFLFLLLIIFCTGQALEAIPKVPKELNLGNIKLKISNSAREDIQKDVNALWASEKYFKIKLKRVSLYMPIVERILKEENVPDELKYLAIQESAFISDAVSTSNAVGFWQMKAASAKEMGLRVDTHVDERMNISASTRAAMRYLKKHNFILNNWVYAVTSYYTGLAGARKFTKHSKNGARTMTIDNSTHWYFKKYLAHRVAFEDALNKKIENDLLLQEYTEGGNQTLDRIAKKFNVDNSEVKKYNKWLLKGKVPADKRYSVIIPTREPLKSLRKTIASNTNESDKKALGFYDEIPAYDARASDPLIKTNLIWYIAKPNDNIESMAARSGLPEKKFRKFNDLENDEKISAGQKYYFEKKKNRATQYYHTAQYGETLWTVSQMYGIKLKKLAKKNRLEKDRKIKPGRVLWLRYKRPKSEPVKYEKVKKPEPVDAEPIVESIPTTSKNEDNASDSEEHKMPEIKGDNKAINKPKETVTAERSEKPSEKDSNFHTVKKGETLYGISRKYKIPLTALLKSNNLTAESTLAIGQKLIVNEMFEITDKESEKKDPSSEEPKKNVHVVRKGDTMYSISRRYNLSVDELMRINQKTDHSLSVGEKLIVSK
ncbi:MAG TPA: LysM peptidoglycan-binding domain-containing protein [Cyclobacteriaceae bacterium]